MYKAIFLDRDGTINEDVGDFCSTDKLIFVPHALTALKILQDHFLLFIITNQTGISKGVFSKEEFLEFNKCYVDFLKKDGIKIEKVYYCPHKKKENCPCRKPSSYFIKKARESYDIDLKKSFVIGDHPHDIEMAHKAGSGSVYLLTGHGRKHRHELLVKPDFIANDLYWGTIWIMENLRVPGIKYLTGSQDIQDT